VPADLSDLLLVAFTWWLVSLSGVLMPGPVSALAISEGARRGVVAGPLITAGHGAAEAAMVAALAVGLNRFLAQPGVVGAIGLLGGLVLLWMGWGIVKASYAPRPDTPGPGNPPTLAVEHTPGSLVRAGILITVSNPYWLLWWATVGAAYFVAFARFGVAAVAALFLAGHLALDLGWTSFLALAVGAGRGRVPERVYRIVLAACGVFVMAMSVYFFYSGVGFIAGR
jgi:threonine/homoserine/homoserine lactone efflux protein